jgi:hypothetical protein
MVIAFKLTGRKRYAIEAVLGMTSRKRAQRIWRRYISAQFVASGFRKERLF